MARVVGSDTRHAAAPSPDPAQVRRERGAAVRRHDTGSRRLPARRRRLDRGRVARVVRRRAGVRRSDGPRPGRALGDHPLVRRQAAAVRAAQPRVRREHRGGRRRARPDAAAHAAPRRAGRRSPGGLRGDADGRLPGLRLARRPAHQPGAAVPVQPGAVHRPRVRRGAALGPRAGAGPAPRRGRRGPAVRRGRADRFTVRRDVGRGAGAGRRRGRSPAGQGPARRCRARPGARHRRCRRGVPAGPRRGRGGRRAAAVRRPDRRRGRGARPDGRGARLLDERRAPAPDGREPRVGRAAQRDPDRAAAPRRAARHPDGPAEPQPDHVGGERRPRGRPAPAQRRRDDDPRPERLQGGQRHPRPPHRGRAAAPGGRPVRAGTARRRHGRAARRGRVRRAGPGLELDLRRRGGAEADGHPGAALHGRRGAPAPLGLGRHRAGARARPDGLRPAEACRHRDVRRQERRRQLRALPSGHRRQRPVAAVADGRAAGRHRQRCRRHRGRAGRRAWPTAASRPARRWSAGTTRCGARCGQGCSCRWPSATA